MDEQKLSRQIFGGEKWKDKYDLDFCHHCETVIIICPYCDNASCSCLSCVMCQDDLLEFSKTKHSYGSYLSEKELNVLEKSRKLRKHIIFCLSKGLTEIDWNLLHKTGNLCLQDYFMFDELKHLRHKGIKDFIQWSGNEEVSKKVVKELIEKYENLN